MSTTIFCTFEQMDLADLAMGHVRIIPGVNSIHYIVEHRDDHHRDGGAVDVVNPLGVVGAANNGSGLNFGIAWINADDRGETPSRPTRVKITCDDSAREKVVATLVNQHGGRIITTP